MKIRIKFQKTGSLRFIGHLDVMRFFQKLNRRAGLQNIYSKGFSPHQLMSFSSPLSLGLSSTGEYVDMELEAVPSKEELLRILNEKSVLELQMLDACLLPDDAKSSMSILAAADYTLKFREGYEPEDKDRFFTEFENFLTRDEIIVTKETKTSEVTENIRPQVFKYERRGDQIFLQLSSGSSKNLKPEFLMKTFFEANGKEFDSMTFEINRDELYGDENGKLKPLISYGKDF